MNVAFNLQKLQMLLGCVQAAIINCRSGKLTTVQNAVLARYAAELEEIEEHLVEVIGTIRCQEDQNDGDLGFGSPDRPGPDV